LRASRAHLRRGPGRLPFILAHERKGFPARQALCRRLAPLAGKIPRQGDRRRRSQAPPPARRGHRSRPTGRHRLGGVL